MSNDKKFPETGMDKALKRNRELARAYRIKGGAEKPDRVGDASPKHWRKYT